MPAQPIATDELHRADVPDAVAPPPAGRRGATPTLTSTLDRSWPESASTIDRPSADQIAASADSVDGEKLRPVPADQRCRSPLLIRRIDPLASSGRDIVPPTEESSHATAERDVLGR